MPGLAHHLIGPIPWTHIYGAPWPPGAGVAYYVDHINGLNANDGRDPANPVQTITYALGLCTADRNDYIIVLEHGAAGVEPVYPVPISVAKVHLIGLGRDGPDPIIRMHGDGGAVFDITGRDVEIAGFGFDTVGAAAAGIVNPGDLFGAWIHHCHFAGSSLGQGLLAGIGIIGDSFPWALIEDNIFSSPNGVGITGNCIGGDIVAGIIRRNYFTAAAGGASPCITQTNVEIGAIVDNYFYCPISDAGIVGWAITLLGAGMEGGPITNNHAMQTGDGTGLNPYRDTSTPGVIGTISHGWGMNYSGQAVIAPAAA